MPLFTGDRNLNEIQTQLALFAPSGGLGIPTGTYGLFTGRPTEDFIIAGQASSGVATVTANNLDIDIQTLGVDESNGPNTITPPIGVIDFKNTNLHFINNVQDIGGSNRQSLLFDNVKIECSVYSAGGSRVSETGVQIGNWHDRGDGSTVETRLPLYTFNDVELRGDNGQTGAIPAGQGGVERANLTLRMTAIRDGSTFGDLSLWNGSGIADTYIDNSPTESGGGQRSNVRGGLFIGATNTHYNNITVGPIGINQVTATDISTEVPQDNMVLGFSNEGNVLGFDTNGKYSASNHFSVVNELDIRALSAGLVDQNAVKYTIGLDGYSNTFFLNPLLGGVTTRNTPTGVSLVLTAPTGLNIGSGFTISDNSTGTDEVLFSVLLANGGGGSPLPNQGTWYFANGDEVSNPNQSPLAGRPLIKSDGLEILVLNQDLDQVQQDIIIGANASQRMPRPATDKSFIFTDEETFGIGIFRLDGTSQSAYVLRGETTTGLVANINNNHIGDFDTNVVAWTGYNGDARSRTLIATAPVFDDIDDSIGLHVLTQSGDRTRDFYEINSSNWSNFNNEPTPITDRKSTVFSAQSSISAIASTSHEYDAPQESLPPEIINNGRLANYVDVQPLLDLEFRKYSWAQQPTSAEFGRLKTVSPAPFDATDIEVLEARNNGFSLRQPNGLWEFTHDIDDSTDPLTTKLGNFEEFEARVKLKQSLVDIVNKIGGIGVGSVSQAGGNTVRWSYTLPLTSLANFGGVRALPSGTVFNANTVGATFTFTIDELDRETGTLVFTNGIPSALQGITNEFEFVSIAEANRPAGPLTGVDLLGLFKANQIDAAYRDNSITETHYALPYTLTDTVLDLGLANLNFVYEDADDTVLATFIGNTWTIPCTALRVDDNRDILTLKTSGSVSIDPRISNELIFSDDNSLNELLINNINQEEAVRYSVYDIDAAATIAQGLIGAGGEVRLIIQSDNQNQRLRVGLTGQIYDDFVTIEDNLGQPLIQTGTQLLTVSPILGINPNVLTTGPNSIGLITPQINTALSDRIILAASPDTVWGGLETVRGLTYLKEQTNHYVELITRLDLPNLITANTTQSLEFDNQYFIFSQEDGDILAGANQNDAAAVLDEIFNSTLNAPLVQQSATREYHPTDDKSGGDGYENGYLKFDLVIPDTLDVSRIVVGLQVSSGTKTSSVADAIEIGEWNGRVLDVSQTGNVLNLEIGFNTITDRDFVANTLESVAYWSKPIGFVDEVFNGKTFRMESTIGVTGQDLVDSLNTYNPSGTISMVFQQGHSDAYYESPISSNWRNAVSNPGEVIVDLVLDTDSIVIGSEYRFRSTTFEPIENVVFDFTLGFPPPDTPIPYFEGIQSPTNVATKVVNGMTVPRYKGRVDLFTEWAADEVLVGCPVYLTNLILDQPEIDYPFSRQSELVVVGANVVFVVEDRFTATGVSEEFITGVETNIKDCIINARNVVIGTR